MSKGKSKEGGERRALEGRRRFRKKFRKLSKVTLEAAEDEEMLREKPRKPRVAEKAA